MTKKTRIINFILNQPNKTVKKKDLGKFICSLYGRIYNPISDRGIWCDNLQPGRGYLMKPSKVEPRYLFRINPGFYTVRGA